MILYVVFMVSVGFALACALAGFHIPELEIISDPLTQKISLLVAILIFVWILVWLPFRRHEMLQKEHVEEIEPLLERLKPKFKLSCGKDIPGCAVMNDKRTHIFLRMLVETDCVDGIKNCCGHLTKIEKNGVTVFDHESRQLPFAPSTDNDSVAKTIYHNTPYFLDVLVLWYYMNQVIVATKVISPAHDKNGAYIFKDNGEYILTVSVSGEKVPTEPTKLRLDWKNDWQAAFLEKIN